MKREVIIIGAGGHSKVCIELLRAMGEDVAYCVMGEGAVVDNCVGVPVLQGDEHIERLREAGYGRVFVAVGSNRLRGRLALRALDCGYQLANAISPHAVISPSASIGVGVAIMAGAVINAEARIEDLSIINTGATVDHDCRVGRCAHLAPQCALAGGVTVGAGSFLGAGCKVVPDVSIGENVILGAGSVAISSISANLTAVGVPAKIIKHHK